VAAATGEHRHPRIALAPVPAGLLPSWT
jgi:hypothetical protein